MNNLFSLEHTGILKLQFEPFVFGVGDEEGFF